MSKPILDGDIATISSTLGAVTPPTFPIIATGVKLTEFGKKAAVQGDIENSFPGGSISTPNGPIAIAAKSVIWSSYSPKIKINGKFIALADGQGSIVTPPCTITVTTSSNKIKI